MNGYRFEQQTRRSARIASGLVGLWLILVCVPASGEAEGAGGSVLPQDARPPMQSGSAATAPANPYVSFRTREWTLNDGLPAPLKRVAQTPDGYLWITTFDGLGRFDGVRFNRYTTDNTPAFRSHDPLGLYVADDGTLWTGDRDGWVYRLRDGAWAAYDLTDILSDHWVQGSAEDATGTL